MVRTAVDLLTGKPKPKEEAAKTTSGPASAEFQKVAQAPAPVREAKCGWCWNTCGEIGKDAICVLADGPMPGGQFQPGRGPHQWLGKNGQFFRWFHHDCLDLYLGYKLYLPEGAKPCRRPGCPHAQHVDGIFCDEHWRNLPDTLHDEIVFAMDEGAEDDADHEAAAKRWKLAARAAIDHYLAKDGWLDAAA